MCATAEGTLYPADAEADFAQRCFDETIVIGMFVQACAVATGTGESVEIEGIYCVIIIIL